MAATSFGSMQFDEDSSDNDPDYEDSGSSEHGEENPIEGDDDNGKEGAAAIARAKQMERVLAKMTATALGYMERYPHVTPPEDVLLEFQRPTRTNPPPATSVAELYDYLDRCTGRVKARNALLSREDIWQLKQSVRAPTAKFSKAEDLRATIDGLGQDHAETIVERQVKFAGQAMTIKQTLKRSSRKFKRLEAEQSGKGALGGALASLDAAMDRLRSLQAVSSMDVSRANWQQFRLSRDLDQELLVSRKEGFISKQSFLGAVDSLQQERAMELQKMMQQRLRNNR